MNSVWTSIIFYWLMWPAIGFTIAAAMVIYIVTGWESSNKAEPVDYPVPYEAWTLP